jgi:hypothetical protein
LAFSRFHARITAQPELWLALEEQMNASLTPAASVVGNIFARYGLLSTSLVVNDFIKREISIYAASLLC